MAERSTDVIRRYISDAIAAEKLFEAHLERLTKESNLEPVRTLFNRHARQTKQQHERLTSLLHQLEGSASGAKGFLEQFFALSLKSAQIGVAKEERSIRGVIVAYAIENSQFAMYECLSTMAKAAGDAETAELARNIQSEKRAMAQEIWALQAAVALDLYRAVTGGGSVRTTA